MFLTCCLPPCMPGESQEKADPDRMLWEEDLTPCLERKLSRKVCYRVILTWSVRAGAEYSGVRLTAVRLWTNRTALAEIWTDRITLAGFRAAGVPLASYTFFPPGRPSNDFDSLVWGIWKSKDKSLINMCRWRKPNNRKNRLDFML